MNRRDFLKWHFQGALWLAAGSAGLIRPFDSLAGGLAEGRPDVAVVRGGQRPAVRAAVDLLGGMGRFVKSGARVVIKPNMSFDRSPEEASNTDPTVVAELAAMCHQAGAAQVLVLDNTLGPAEACIERSGIGAACALIKDDMVHNISSERLFDKTPLPRGRAMTETEIMKEVKRADVLIAAPKAKSHGATGVSLSLKGMMGLIYNRREMHWKYDLSTAVVDICTVLKADLTVIDGSRVLSSGGPGGPGRVLEEQTIIASADMVAADAMAVSLFKWSGRRYSPGQVAHIRQAHERGLGRMDLDNLSVKKISL